jgi:hypothetical protein
MATKKRQTTWPGKGIPRQRVQRRQPEPIESTWLYKVNPAHAMKVFGYGKKGTK